MKNIKTRSTAVKEIKRDIGTYLNLTDKLKDDVQLLLIALHELEPIRYHADEWDLLYFSTSRRLQSKFVEARKIIRNELESLEVIIGLLEKMEDPQFFHENKTHHGPKRYDYYYRQSRLSE